MKRALTISLLTCLNCYVYQYGTLRAGVLLALARFIIEITTKIITQVYVSVSNLINRNYHLSNFSLNNAHRVKRDN